MFQWFSRMMRRRNRPARPTSRKVPVRDYFPIGRGTYGHPMVRQWANLSTLEIGAFCSIADNVTIFLDGEHRTDWLTTYPFSDVRPSARGIAGHPRSRGDVLIGNDVWIGYGVTILSGVTVGNGAVLGACSLVTGDVPSYGVVAGNPAKLLRKRLSEATIQTLERLAWWDWPDDMLDQAMRFLLASDIQALADFAARHGLGNSPHSRAA